MLGAFRVRLRRAHHANSPMHFLGEEGGAQIIISHVRGQDNGAGTSAKFFEPFGAVDLVGKFFVENSVDRGLGNRPGKIIERAKGAQIIHRARRTGQHDREIGDDCAPRRRGEEEKEDREKSERDRIKKERQINDRPVEILPPKDAFDGKTAQPGCAAHSSVAVALWATPVCLVTRTLTRLTEARLQGLKSWPRVRQPDAGYRARKSAGDSSVPRATNR